MITQEYVEEKLFKWMKTFVEQPHPLMNNWPVCPFARQARINNNILIRPGHDPLTDGLDLMENYDWSKEVVIFWYPYDPIAWSGERFVARVEELNKILLPKDIVALEDHPDVEEIVSGIKMNFEYFPLLILQRNSKLNQAADQLRAKGYYDTWSQKDLDKIVTWRYNE